MMMHPLRDIAQDIYTQAEKTYNDAIASYGTIEQFSLNIPVGNEELWQKSRRIENTFHQVISAAWHAKYAAEKLLEDMNNA